MGKSAIVVGAGLAGAAAAYTLHQAGWQVRIIERNDRVGGRANTVATQGYLIDTAASGVASTYTAYLALVRELGMATDIVPASPLVGLARDDRVHEFDMRRLGWSALRTRLLSLPAKLRLLRLFADVFGAKRRGMLDWSDLGKAAPLDNESVADYALRTLGTEAYDYFCDPVVRVMLLTNGDRVSRVDFFSGIANVLQATMMSLRGGQQVLPERLVRDLSVALRSRVETVTETGDGVAVTWTDADGQRHDATADTAVLATDLHTATAVCPALRPALQPLGDTLRYTRALSIAIGATVRTRTRSFIVFVPTREERGVATLFLEHNKSPDRAPAGHSLITAYFEEAESARRWEEDDATLVASTLDYVLRLFPELRGHVDMTHVTRWSPALPVMRIGGYGEVARVHERLDPAARIQACGDYLSGAGQGTAVDFGIRAARNLLTHRK